MQSILTTESVPPPRRAEYWEEMVTQQFVPVRCVPSPGSAFSARIRSLALDAVTLCDVRSHGTDVLRTAQHVAGSQDNFFLLSLQLKGIGQLAQSGRRVVLHPGDMALYDTARAYELKFAAEQQQLVLRIPREALLARCQQVESLVGIGIPGTLPVARLIGDLIRDVTALEALQSDRSRRSIASTLIDLILDGLTAQRPQDSSQAGAARLTDAQRIARQQLTDPNFSVARWALAMDISDRYLRLLFAASGQSPAQYLWQQRLELAAAQLRDPACRHLPITEIAFASGFSDSAHFSHAFRTAYGTTPRRYRGIPGAELGLES